ncbi:MAG: Hpt domain-containing protein [Phycisphaerales bacterium]|nr:Hpt domain-containing protein [Phycisphaerales bacterium]
MSQPLPPSQPTPSPTPASGAIRSEFANDPDMREIVEMYVQEMPQRVAKLEELWAAQQMDELKRLAHQIKGSSGGYGFVPVGGAAGKVEASLMALSEGSASASLDQLRNQFEELLSMCRRVTM